VIGIFSRKTVWVVLLVFAIGAFCFTAEAQQSGSRPQPPPNSDQSPSEQSDQSKQAPQEPIEQADELKTLMRKRV